MAGQATGAAHRWRFARLGGFDQVIIDSGDDLRHLGELDQKLWAALACPAAGLHFDARTLALLDSDGDGRIRPPEVLAAVESMCRVLKDPGDLFKHADGLPLAAIDDGTPEGRALLASAKRILAHAGKPDATVITAEETALSSEVFTDAAGFNGDGVVPAEVAAAAGDKALAAAITDIIGCVGGVPDRSGAAGVDQAQLDAFLKAAGEYLAWWHEADADAATLLPLGDATEQAAELFEAVRAKIDDYFTRAGLADFDARAAEHLNPSDADYAALAMTPLTTADPSLAAFPLARAEPGRPLPLAGGINPSWAGPLAAFRDAVVVPLLGRRDSLNEAEWEGLKTSFAAHAAWRTRRRGEVVAPLGHKRVEELAAGNVKGAIEALIARDRELADVAAAVDAVDRLVHYYRHLDVLLHNFVSLNQFYSPGERAVFECGTLYLDGRACELCVRVEDIDAHAPLAVLSQTYLAYCDCRRRGGDERMTIAAGFTAGTGDNLMVGRNGIFYDRDGNDWDATIVRLVEHAISVREAFWTPYRRIGRLVAEQIERFAGEREKAVEAGGSKALVDLAAPAAAPAAGAPAPAAPAPFDIAKFAGIFAAMGLAVGAIGTALASVLTGFMKLPWWEMPLVIAGLFLLISGPSMLIAYLKLRRRNLAPLLDANGWAVNTRARINLPFGATLTEVAALPRGAERTLRDPFADKRSPWGLYLFLLVLFAVLGGLWQQGYLAQWWTQFQAMQAANAPASADAAPAAGQAAPAPAGEAAAKPAAEAAPEPATAPAAEPEPEPEPEPKPEPAPAGDAASGEPAAPAPAD